MWNEFMEWVDEWDNPIPISDEDEYEDEDKESASDKTMGLIVVAAVLPNFYCFLPLLNITSNPSKRLYNRFYDYILYLSHVITKYKHAAILAVIRG